MTRTAILGGKLLTPLVLHPRGAIVIEGSTIVFAGPEDEAPLEGAKLVHVQGLVCPGFVDIHIHGAAGIIFASTDSSDDVYCARRGLLSGGTTSFLATVGSIGVPSRTKMIQAVQSCSEYCGNVTPGNATMLGLHLEGPLLSPQRAGVSKAWPQEEDKRPAIRQIEELIKAARGHVRLVTLAPELQGATDAIDVILNSSAVASLGHTDATYEQAKEAFNRGARHVTHLFNAMRPFNHREPGVIGATLDDSRVLVELICDGVHVHPASLRLALRSKLPDKAVLVTDGTGLDGLSDGVHRYSGDGTDIYVQNGKATLADGTIAGSTMRMNQQVRFLTQNVGLSITEAVRMCTKNAAQAIGVSSKGELVAGKDADIVVLNDRFDVTMVSVMGHIMEVPQ